MYDHYMEARAIAETLQREGLASDAASIRRAIDTGVSGTEIFMQLRFLLAPLLAAPSVSQVTKARIRNLHLKLDEALR
jgi:hypothetical protein